MGVTDYELPLITGETYESMITESAFTLSDSTKTTVNPSVVQTGADVKIYKVDIAVQGNGEATGINTYSVGEFAKVCAHPNEGEKFLGGYENGNLISVDAEYKVVYKATDDDIDQKIYSDRDLSVSIGRSSCHEPNQSNHPSPNLSCTWCQDNGMGKKSRILQAQYITFFGCGANCNDIKYTGKLWNAAETDLRGGAFA